MGIKIKQHDITDCGAACLASISAYYKLKFPIARIRQYAGTDQKGTNLFGVIQAAEKLGFSAKGVRAAKNALDEIPTPCIAHVILENQLHHYVVIYKITTQYVKVMDPAIGKFKKYSISEWEALWSGILVMLSPAANFESGNHKTSLLNRFWYLLKPHRWVLFQALVGAVIYTILGLSTSIYIQKITDHVLVNGNTKLLNLLGVLMVGILLIQVFIGIMKSIFMIKTGQQIDAQLILGYYKHLIKLPQSFFDQMRVGEILSRIGDAVKIRAFINEVAISLVVNVFIIVFSFILMFTYYWKLAVIISLIIPFYSVIYFVTNQLNKKRERKLMEDAASLENQLVESLTAVRTIKQFSLEHFANFKTETRFIQLLTTTYQSAMTSLFSGNTSMLVSRIFTIILLWVGAYYVVEQIITPGELLSFYAIIGYFTGPASSLIGMNKTIQNAFIAADRLFEIIDLEQEPDTHNIQLKKELIGDIKFHEVSFTYGTRRPVFENLSLTIEQGKTTAIVGESGSGKSTITSLLQRLYPVDAGHISIGAYDLKYISIESIRELIGVVPQQLDLFAGNIIENIALGDEHPDLKIIIDICRQLGLLGFIEALPQGFETYIGENGANLSGGQKQRIAIARALYRNPEILILDEATSSLDSESEEYVLNTIGLLQQKGKTIIMIAHRLSTVMHADQIIVLSKGKLAEHGKHASLIRQHGHYQELWEKQFPPHIQLQMIHE